MHGFKLAQLGNRFTELSVVAIASIAVTTLIVGIRQIGSLEVLELVAFDRLVQLRADQSPDPRLLVVGITETDIQTQKQWPLSDQVLEQLLEQLEQYQPQAIGIDIWRDIPVEPGHAALIKRLKTSNHIFVITKLGSENEPAIAPPPGISKQQVGFNDVVVDSGGVIRRNLLYLDDYFPSFSLRLALHYLKAQGIEEQASVGNPNHMQLGTSVFVPLQPNDGSYIDVDSRGYQILLNYRSARRSVQQVSLTSVLKGEVKPELIKDRIVLIGTTAESGKDFFYTPYSSGLRNYQRMPGVVIHTQMVSQILDAATGKRSLYWFWSEPQEIGWILLWAVLGGLLAWGVRQPLALAITSGVALCLLFIICWQLFQIQGWIPFIPPALTFLATGGSVVAFTAHQAQRQQQMVMRLLGQSTSAEIAETLWQRRDDLLKDGKLSGQRLIATILFTDLRGFSTISEHMSPEALLEWLNEYLEKMTLVVQMHHGVINKFTGDGIMAIFGVPIPRKDPEAIAANAQQAVACALAMGQCLQHLNSIWRQRQLPTVEMRAGIFTGPVVVGSLGSKTRLEYGVIGDSVNIASRLESVDKHRQLDTCRVLIAHETLVYLQERFEVERWGPLSLKGKEQKIQVYRVVGPVKSMPSDDQSGEVSN